MNTQEKLNAIKERCQANLALAAKRTQGAWAQDHIYVDTLARCNDFIKAEGNVNNAAFIAACAGAAEAGWKATIAAIDDSLSINPALSVERQQITTKMMLIANSRMVETILAAWEGIV